MGWKTQKKLQLQLIPTGCCLARVVLRLYAERICSTPDDVYAEYVGSVLDEVQVYTVYTEYVLWSGGEPL